MINITFSDLVDYDERYTGQKVGLFIIPNIQNLVRLHSSKELAEITDLAQDRKLAS